MHKNLKFFFKRFIFWYVYSFTQNNHPRTTLTTFFTIIVIPKPSIGR